MLTSSHCDFFSPNAKNEALHSSWVQCGLCGSFAPVALFQTFSTKEEFFALVCNDIF